jgi:hypothetical protein
MPRFPRPRKADIVVILLSVLITGGSAYAAFASYSGARDLVVTAAGESYAYPLGADAEFDVMGPLGPTRISIKAGQARVLSSPCQNKLCIAAGAISAGGQWVACLPNQVLMRVGGSGSGVDASAY